MKYYRIGYFEDGAVHYTVPIQDTDILTALYKDFDAYSIANNEDIWVESIEGEWKREG